MLVEWADFPDEASEEAPSHRDGPEALLGHRLVLRQRGRPVRLVPPGPADRAVRIGGDVLLTDAGGRSELSAPEPAIAFADEIERPVHHRERFTVAY